MWLVRANRDVRRTSAPTVSPQALAALAEPYRSLLGEAVQLERTLNAEIEQAPEVLRPSLGELSGRVARVLEPAYRKAQQGTQLQAQLLRLEPSDPQHAAAAERARSIEQELRDLTDQTRDLYSRTLRVIDEAQRLEPHADPQHELSEAMDQVTALEEVFRDLGDTFGEPARPPTSPKSSRDPSAD